MATSRIRPLYALLASVALAILAVSVPASSAQADSVVSVNLQVQGGSNNQNLGNLTGTISKSGTLVSYSLTLCRQSSYTPPRGTISSQQFYSNYQGSCSSHTGSFTQQGPLVTVTVTGNTFYPGNTFLEITKSQTYYVA